MSKRRSAYPPEFRRQMVELVPSGRNPEELRGSLSRFATLECELLDRRRLKTQAEAKLAIFDFLEGSYNPHRRHSSIGYLSPVKYERRICPTLNPQPPQCTA